LLQKRKEQEQAHGIQLSIGREWIYFCDDKIFRAREEEAKQFPLYRIMNRRFIFLYTLIISLSYNITIFCLFYHREQMPLFTRWQPLTKKGEIKNNV
jgi:hypothetical protein